MYNDVFNCTTVAQFWLLLFYGFSFHQILKSEGEDEDETSGEKGGKNGGER